eukprot:TRINITY_DN904_c1_g1_i1.p1 TRINITY_DN904_c1_g1~~TRINITY_DN904_c1_g1_i1.p1  ORF type:complete len:990 (+),score=191.22 TRINITY_DN904_c1_g1_i1:83-3052(+)
MVTAAAGSETGCGPPVGTRRRSSAAAGAGGGARRSTTPRSGARAAPGKGRTTAERHRPGQGSNGPSTTHPPPAAGRRGRRHSPPGSARGPQQHRSRSATPSGRGALGRSDSRRSTTPGCVTRQQSTQRAPGASHTQTAPQPLQLRRTMTECSEHSGRGRSSTQFISGQRIGFGGSTPRGLSERTVFGLRPPQEPLCRQRGRSVSPAARSNSTRGHGSHYAASQKEERTQLPLFERVSSTGGARSASRSPAAGWRRGGRSPSPRPAMRSSSASACDAAPRLRASSAPASGGHHRTSGSAVQLRRAPPPAKTDGAGGDGSAPPTRLRESATVSSVRGGSSTASAPHTMHVNAHTAALRDLEKAKATQAAAGAVSPAAATTGTGSSPPSGALGSDGACDISSDSDQPAASVSPAPPVPGEQRPCPRVPYGGAEGDDHISAPGALDAALAGVRRETAEMEDHLRAMRTVRSRRGQPKEPSPEAPPQRLSSPAPRTRSCESQHPVPSLPPAPAPSLETAVQTQSTPPPLPRPSVATAATASSGGSALPSLSPSPSPQQPRAAPSPLGRLNRLRAEHQELLLEERQVTERKAAALVEEDYLAANSCKERLRELRAAIDRAAQAVTGGLEGPLPVPYPRCSPDVQGSERWARSPLGSERGPQGFPQPGSGSSECSAASTWALITPEPQAPPPRVVAGPSCSPPRLSQQQQPGPQVQPPAEPQKGSPAQPPQCDGAPPNSAVSSAVRPPSASTVAGDEYSGSARDLSPYSPDAIAACAALPSPCSMLPPLPSCSGGTRGVTSRGVPTPPSSPPRQRSESCPPADGERPPPGRLLFAPAQQQQQHQQQEEDQLLTAAHSSPPSAAPKQDEWAAVRQALAAAVSTPSTATLSSTQPLPAAPPLLAEPQQELDPLQAERRPLQPRGVNFSSPAKAPRVGAGSPGHARPAVADAVGLPQTPLQRSPPPMVSRVSTAGTPPQMQGLQWASSPSPALRSPGSA